MKCTTLWNHFQFKIILKKNSKFGIHAYKVSFALLRVFFCISFRFSLRMQICHDAYECNACILVFEKLGCYTGISIPSFNLVTDEPCLLVPCNCDLVSLSRTCRVMVTIPSSGPQSIYPSHGRTNPAINQSHQPTRPPSCPQARPRMHERPAPRRGS